MIQYIKIADLVLSPENGYFIQEVNDLGYSTKYPFAKTLFSHGANLGDAYFENRLLSIVCKIVGSSISDFISKRSELFKVLSVNEFGSDEIPLEFKLANGRELIANGVLKDVGGDVKVADIMAGDILFTFEFEKPWFESKNIYQVDFGITQGGGASVPMAIPLDFTQGSSGFSVVNNGGNVFAFPEIYFYGPLTNPVLENITIGKSINLNETINDGEYIRVDTFNRVVVNQSGANKRDKVSGDFIVLAVGENQFRLSSDVPTESGFVRFIFRYPYISL